jgi:hypothetical protein
MNSNTDAQSLFIKCVLIALFCLAALRFVGFVYRFGSESIQMDFSAYYTAGEALNLGLSPYTNNMRNNPPVWDGVDIYNHSRFLYPPVAAYLFQPLALLPYHVSKYLWEVISLACIIVSLFITTKIFPIKNVQQYLFIGIFVCMYHPLLIHMERGQIDALVLVFITMAFYLMIQETKQKDLAAGVLLALATIFKLHCVYVLPFLVLRKRWHTINGYVLGGLIVIVISVLMPGGKTLLSKYVFEEIPRISKFGELGTDSMKISDGTIQTVKSNADSLHTIKDQRVYLVSYFNFVSNATAVKIFQIVLNKYHKTQDISIISVGLLLLLFFILAFWQRRCYPNMHLGRKQEFIYWQIILTIVLISGPLTWVMTIVWSLPVLVIFVSE